MEFLQWNKTASELIKTKAGEYAFCRDCEQNKTCDHSYGKIHPISGYIYHYLIEFENGVKIYPQGKSWEYEPEWFVNLLTVAQNKLHEIQADPKWQEMQKVK